MFLELGRGEGGAGKVLMQKQDLIEWLVRNGDEAKAFELEASDVPEFVDTEKDRELLAQHGIDVEALPGRR